MTVGYYPGWDSGFVKDYLDELRGDGQRRKAAVRILQDIQDLSLSWPPPRHLTVKIMRGREPLWELIREYQGIEYRVFFCKKERDIWLLHNIEKKRKKTPENDLKTAYDRMQNVLSGKVRR
jgi:phage-related protein